MNAFRSSFFALSPLAVPALIAATKPQAHQPKLTAGQIGVFGVLGQNDWFTDTDYSAIRSGVQRALADPNTKTVDLVIDSPGGSVLGLPETAEAIHAANKIKPVRAFVTGVAASAAYWLASQASTITLTPSGEVGSVGVLDIHADITQALANSGVKLTAVPVVVNNAMPSVTTTGTFSGVSPVAFGDFKRFVIRDAERGVPYVYRYSVPAKDGSAVLALQRSDSKLTVPVAISKVTVTA